jgi:hypothetical protein
VMTACDTEEGAASAGACRADAPALHNTATVHRAAPTATTDAQYRSITNHPISNGLPPFCPTR